MGTIPPYNSNKIHIVREVSGPNYATYLNQTPMLEWCVVKRGSKNGHRKGYQVF